MRPTLYALLAGLSLIPSITFSKPSEPKMDPLVVKVVELLKADPATISNSQPTRATDFSHCSATAICPAKYGVLISYTQKFQEGDKIISLNYSDYDDNFERQEPQYFQSDGVVGSADSLTISISYGKSRGYFFYEFKDNNLDGKVDSTIGDVLELGVSSDQAHDYYFEKKNEIDQKYTYLLKETEKRLTQKKE